MDEAEETAGQTKATSPVIKQYILDNYGFKVPVYTSLRIEGLADHDYDKLGAILECESSMSIAEMLEVIDERDNFDLLSQVHTDEGLGYHYAECAAPLMSYKHFCNLTWIWPGIPMT